MMPEVSEPIRWPHPPKLLLLDTCGSEASVAVAEGRAIVAQTMLPGRGASEGLVGAISEILGSRSWRLQELDALVIVRGPGSFTGVRVGVSVAKGLAEGSGRPLIAVSRLEVLAQKARTASLAVLDAGRGEVFWAPVLAEGIGAQGVAPMAWVTEHARSLKLPVLCEVRGDSGDRDVDFHEVPALAAADALPVALDRLWLGQTDDPLLMDGLYLHRTEQETLDRQRRHRAMDVTTRSRG